MQIDLNKIKEPLLNFFKLFWQKLFLFLVFFLLIDLILGGFLFWHYYLKAEQAQIFLPPTLTINQSFLNDFSAKWQEKELNFEQALSKDFPDLFNPVVSD